MPPKSRKKPNIEDEDGVVVGTSPDGERFTFFYGPTPVFSNFHPSPFTLDGKEFNCGEQYFHYMKAVHFNDEETGEMILRSESPSEQKKLGRQVKGYAEQEWKEHGPKYMKNGILAKFEQNRNLRSKLFATRGTTLVEASPRDRKWGIGLGVKDPKAWDRKNWKGSNLLGRILNDVREELLQRTEFQSEAPSTSV